MGFTYGWGTLVCQECHGAKKCRNSKRCKPCNYKSKEFEEILRESQIKRFEDPEERRKLRNDLNRPEVKKRKITAQLNSSNLTYS